VPPLPPDARSWFMPCRADDHSPHRRECVRPVSYRNQITPYDRETTSELSAKRRRRRPAAIRLRPHLKAYVDLFRDYSQVSDRRPAAILHAGQHTPRGVSLRRGMPLVNTRSFNSEEDCSAGLLQLSTETPKPSVYRAVSKNSPAAAGDLI
jgi:hypothetical protein